MNIILIPVYNDWKSLNYLLFQINEKISSKNLTKILIINDNSTQKINIERKKLNKIKEIKILTLKQNLGSQKSIAIGLNYLKKLNDTFYITVMDGDGEDNPSKISKMISVAKKDLGRVVTSHRKKRNENYLIKFSYKIHLLVSLLLTWNWINFGNFSCFHSSNLNRILLNNNIWLAYSAGILKNCKVNKIYTTRQKRYFGNSKVNFLKLVEHSLRIIGVFYERVIVSSLLYIFVVYNYFPKFNNFFYFFILILNILILFIKYKNYKKEPFSYKTFVKDIKKF